MHSNHRAMPPGPVPVFIGSAGPPTATRCSTLGRVARDLLSVPFRPSRASFEYLMSKVAILVLADTETHGDLGRVFNPLVAAKEFRAGGDDVRLVFD